MFSLPRRVRAADQTPLATRPLTDPNLLFVGRWDKRNPQLYHSYWGGAYLRANFNGKTVEISLARDTTLVVSLDGETPRTVVGNQGLTNLAKQPLEAGNHSLLVGSASQNDEVELQGLVLEQGAITLPVTARPIIEFVGDSITTGGGQTLPFTVNYAWQSAETLGADHVQIAFSARALTTGFGCAEDKTGLDAQYFQLKNFNHLGDQPQTPWDFSYTPRIIVINLGQNDQCGGEPPPTMLASYLSFVEKLRARFPRAFIVALRPFSGAYENTIRAAVNVLSARDRRVQFVDTTGWLEAADFLDGTHPSEVGHAKVAARLSEILRPLLSVKD